MGAKRRAKMSMPCTRRLFETIDGFNQVTEMSRMRRINKSRRLPHIHFLFKHTMKESILNIKLMQIPTSSNNY
jgi:hypothetical protein